MQRESADDHGAQRSDCGPPQQVNPRFSFEENDDSSSKFSASSRNAVDGPPQQVNPRFSFEGNDDSSSKFTVTSRNAVDINATSITDTMAQKGIPNDYTRNNLNWATSDVSSTDTKVSTKNTNNSPDEATNDPLNKDPITIWGDTNRLYNRLRDLHSALTLYDEFDYICPENPPLWSHFHTPFLAQITFLYLIDGFLKLKFQKANVGFLAQLAQMLVDINTEEVEVEKEEPTTQSLLALGRQQEKRGAVRMRVKRYLSVFCKGWQDEATTELTEMRKALMRQVVDAAETGVWF